MHLLDHSDVPPPRVCCEICGSTFKSERNRIRHVRRHQETGVPCPHCQKISPNRNALKSHIVSVHSKPMLQCHLCDKKFKRTLALTVSIGFGSMFDGFFFIAESYFFFLIFRRNMWPHTPGKTCTIAPIAHKSSNTIPVCICIIEAFIQSNGMPIVRRKKDDRRKPRNFGIPNPSPI